jgi:glutamate N-acetyltransferase / amino-acid N-acetyltransferase
MSVTAAGGFEAAGVHAGIRRARKDLAVIRSTEPAVGAALFTSNRVRAAPVLVSKAHLSVAEPQALVVNSGVANAATGPRGMDDALATAAAAARLLGLRTEEVLVFSTGVIGAPLPVDRLLAGLPGAVAALSEDGGPDAAEAIVTTDTHPKQARISGDGFTVGGMAKGSGMIHPRLATMLAFLTTDYPLEPGEPIELLRPAVDRSFNSISVDGECSTNDAVVLLANGASGLERTAASDERFALALRRLCAELAEEIVADGEGATLVATIVVSGAPDEEQARSIAARIATSPLVKTALFGRDANWGRVVAAAGSAPHDGGFAALDPERLSLTYNGTAVLARGAPRDVPPEVEAGDCRIELDLGLGDASATYLTTDLSYDYVRINAEYRT